nr:response regulator transcription factor [uncultured Schaedlerella sp.]
MDSDKMRNENIAVTQKILFLSYRHELYEKFCFCLAGQHDILYHRIREHKNDRIPWDHDIVLCMVEMLRYTDESAELIRKMRRKADAPLLFISGAKTEETRRKETVQAIRSGADGYLVNTQSAEEIAAEAEALIRLQRRIKNNPEIWDYEGLQIVPDQRQVFLRGKEILLTRIEFDIVHYLAAQNGRAVPYQELYEAVWQNEYLPDHGGIMAHVHRIRGKLETDARKPRYIRNVYGVGYRFGCSCKGKYSILKNSD